MREPEARPVIAGGTVLVTVLLILALVIFAILSLTGYQADERLFDNLRTGTVQYYAAECQLHERLAGLRADGVDGLFKLEADAGNGQALTCSVRLDPDGTYQILEWKLVRTEPWSGDYTLPVYQEE